MLPTPTPVLRVLHLEDNSRDAELIGYKLARAGVGCDIVLATDRESFDVALSTQPFDLVLCDYNLPGYDGISALKRVKQVRPDAPVIIISGTVGEDEAVRCLHAGATDYLLKQHLERLGPAVRRAIQEAAERRSRAEAEEALQQRERRLSSIHEAVADILFYVEVERDGTYRFVSVNPAFELKTGLDDGFIVGKRLHEIVSADRLGLICERYAQAIRERRIVRWEESWDYPKGRLVGEVSVSPVFDGAGRCTHLVVSVHDATEQRQLEAQLRQAQKMDSVGQLAGGIAHDFNNLLTVINGMAELVLNQLGEKHEHLRSDVLEIRGAGERAAGLTRQLLAFSRKQLLQPQVIDLNTTVAEMGSLLRRLLGEHIQLVIAPAKGGVNIKADRGQIEQVIANLAVNARDAMPDGGTLTIETRTVDVDEAFGRERGVAVSPGPYVVLAMSDTGIGMDEAIRRSVFEPFFTTKAPGKGTGLGLSTVYGIVKQSGGFIWVESEVGRGTCFTIYLRHVAGAASTRRGGASPAPAGGTETVLVVEDVAGLRQLITRTLKSDGYTVLAAATGEEALRVLEQYDGTVDLVVTDVVMPGMSGRELAEQLDKTRPGTKVIYMSGYADDNVVRRGIGEHGVAFVSKPFSKEELVSAVREILGA